MKLLKWMILFSVSALMQPALAEKSDFRPKGVAPSPAYLAEHYETTELLEEEADFRPEDTTPSPAYVAFAKAHAVELKAMVADYEKVQYMTGVAEDKKRIYEKITKRIDNCFSYTYAIFFNKYQTLIEGIDTYPYSLDGSDQRKNRYDSSVLTDPRAIAAEVRRALAGKEDGAYIFPSYKKIENRLKNQDLQRQCADIASELK